MLLQFLLYYSFIAYSGACRPPSSFFPQPAGIMGRKRLREAEASKHLTKMQTPTLDCHAPNLPVHTLSNSKEWEEKSDSKTAFIYQSWQHKAIHFFIVAWNVSLSMRTLCLSGSSMLKSKRSLLFSWLCPVTSSKYFIKTDAGTAPAKQGGEEKQKPDKVNNNIEFQNLHFRTSHIMLQIYSRYFHWHHMLDPANNYMCIIVPKFTCFFSVAKFKSNVD